MWLHVHIWQQEPGILSCAAFVQSVRVGGGRCKRLGHKKRPAPFCALGIRPARLRAGAVYQRAKQRSAAAAAIHSFRSFFHSLTMAGRSFPACRHRAGQPVVWLP